MEYLDSISVSLVLSLCCPHSLSLSLINSITNVIYATVTAIRISRVRYVTFDNTVSQLVTFCDRTSKYSIQEMLSTINLSLLVELSSSVASRRPFLLIKREKRNKFM